MVNNRDSVHLQPDSRQRAVVTIMYGAGAILMRRQLNGLLHATLGDAPGQMLGVPLDTVVLLVLRRMALIVIQALALSLLNGRA